MNSSRRRPVSNCRLVRPEAGYGNGDGAGGGSMTGGSCSPASHPVSRVIASVDDGATLQASFAQVHNTRESSCQTVADPLSDPDVVVWKLRLAAGRRGRDVFENENEHEIGVNLDLKRRKTIDPNKHDTGVGPDDPINGDVDMTEN